MEAWPKDQLGRLSKVFTFKNYRQSFAFVSQVAMLSEKKNHHPDIVIGWCTVEVKFTSHDLGGVSEKCLELSKLTDELFKVLDETS